MPSARWKAMPGLNLATELNDVEYSHLAVQIRSSRPVRPLSTVSVRVM